MRNNLFGGRLKGNTVESERRLPLLQTLGGTLTMNDAYPSYLILDPGGAGRTILLPAEADGLFYQITNFADAVELLTVKEDSNTTTIAEIAPGETVAFMCMSGTWRTFRQSGGSVSGLVKGAPAPTSLATAGAITYTIAQLKTGLIVRDPAGAARTDVLPTAALAVAGLPGVQVGDWLFCDLTNGADAAEAITLDAGSGGAYDTNQTAASRIVPQNAGRVIKMRFTNVTASSEAYVVYLV